YTLAGSLFTLLGVLGIALTLASEGPARKMTFSIPELVQQADAHSRALEDNLTRTKKELEAEKSRKKEKEEAAVEPEAATARLFAAENALSHWRRGGGWGVVASDVG